MCDGLVLHTMWQLRIRRGISAAEFAPEKKEVPAPNWVTQPQALVPRKEVPIISVCEKQWELHPRKMKGCKRLMCSSWGATDLLTHRLTRSKPQMQGWHLRKHQKRERTKLTSFKVRTGGAGVWAAVPWDGSSVRRHCFFVELSSSSANPAQAGTKSVLTINLINTTWPCDPLRASPTQLTYLAWSSIVGKGETSNLERQREVSSSQFGEW